MGSRQGDIEEILSVIEKTDGWRVERRGGHPRIYPATMKVTSLDGIPPGWRVKPDIGGFLVEPTPITMSLSPSSVRSREERLTDLSRSGFDVSPWRKQSRRKADPACDTPETDNSTEALQEEPVTVSAPSAEVEELRIESRAPHKEYLGVAELLLSNATIRYGCTAADHEALMFATVERALTHRATEHANGTTRPAAGHFKRAATADIRIADMIEARIKDPDDHAFADGRLLPPQRTLAAGFNTSTFTISHAVRELVRRGLVVSVPGSGAWVGYRPTSDEDTPYQVPKTALAPRREPAVPVPAPTVAAPAPAAPAAPEDARAKLRRARALLEELERNYGPSVADALAAERVKKELAAANLEVARLTARVQDLEIKNAGLQRRIDRFRAALEPEV
jgi:Bacterial regulatory proteins, gntR family